MMVATPPHTTLPLPQSTPIKVNSSTTLSFTTHNKYCIESCTAMAEEMAKYFVGPMPFQQFLDDVFPVKELPSLSNIPRFRAGKYKTTVKAKLEANAYSPFVSLKCQLSNNSLVFPITFVLQGKNNSTICS
jgi:hypothetical protein